MISRCPFFPYFLLLNRGVKVFNILCVKVWRGGRVFFFFQIMCVILFLFFCPFHSARSERYFFHVFFAVIDVSSLIVLDFSLVVVFSLNMGLFPYHKGALVKVLPQYWWPAKNKYKKINKLHFVTWYMSSRVGLNFYQKSLYKILKRNSNPGLLTIKTIRELSGHMHGF